MASETQAAHTGRIWLDDRVIRNRSTWCGDWDLPVEEVVLIAEETDENGPFADDWFLQFVSKDGSWFTGSVYATIRTKFREELERHFSGVNELRLVNSASYKSRVLWPPELVGKPAIRFFTKPPRHIVQRLWWLIVGPEIWQEVEPEIREYLRQRGAC